MRHKRMEQFDFSGAPPFTCRLTPILPEVSTRSSAPKFPKLPAGWELSGLARPQVQAFFVSDGGCGGATAGLSAAPMQQWCQAQFLTALYLGFKEAVRQGRPPVFILKVTLGYTYDKISFSGSPLNSFRRGPELGCRGTLGNPGNNFYHAGKPPIYPA